jgi:uncharacterized protein
MPPSLLRPSVKMGPVEHVRVTGIHAMAVEAPLQERYQRALDTFVERARGDPYIVAVVLCGSLSHDRVWHKSDIDLLLVAKEKPGYDKGESTKHISLVEDGINIHATLQARGAFRRMVEGSLHNSFLHSLVAKGKLVFTRDPALAELLADLQKVGSRDQRVQLLRAASGVIPTLYKAQKWLHVKRDLDYSFLWVLHCVTGLAQIEISAAGQLAGREVIQQALEINPAFFAAIYTDLIAAKKNVKTIAAALDAIDDYLTRRVRLLFTPILDYLEEAGAPRSATEIETHFTNQLGICDVITACEWLADKDVIRKVSTPVRLTERSPVAFEELAFYYDGQP